MSTEKTPTQTASRTAAENNGITEELKEDVRALIDEAANSRNPHMLDDFDDIMLAHGFDGDPCELLSCLY